jgi:hypothetical protein
MRRNRDFVSGIISVPLAAVKAIQSMIKNLVVNSYVFCLVRSVLTSVFPCQHSVWPDRPFNPYVVGSSPTGPTNVMSRDIVGRCQDMQSIRGCASVGPAVPKGR